MKEYKKSFSILMLALFFSFFNLARAEVFINEVELSPTAERFIELYNNGNEPIELTGWYMQRKTATGTSFGSLVSNSNFMGKIIGANDYFVISKNSLNNSNIVLDSLTLTESNTIQIKNSSGDVMDKIGWGDVSDCVSSCPPNPSEGKSIQKISAGSWIVATPTPGAVNASSSDSNNSSNTVSTSTGTETQNKTTEIFKIKTEILAKNISFVGIPMTFEANATGYSNERLSYGKYFWNFGDGDSKEVKMSDISNLQKFTHTYFYPGDYDVTLEYYQNYYGNIPDAFDRMIVKVVEVGILISRVGDEKDFFIELANNTNYDADISNWILSSSDKSFIIPKNTVLKSKNKIIISPRITNFSILDKNTLKLMTPQGEIAFDYGASIVKFAPNKVTSDSIAQTPSLILPLNKGEMPKAEGVNIDVQVPAENLSASVISSDSVISNPVRTYFLSFILTIFIGASAGVVYFIRQKRNIPNVGDDFKILDE